MNKTVNINLGGIFYYIDEDAFQKLTNYFDAIKRSLSNAYGQDEILKDIEGRVSELLTEKQKSDKHVVGMKEVEAVIAVMGQPEDYKIDSEDTKNKSTHFTSSVNNSSIKKLYRDKDNGAIGGVLSGLGHYFGINKVWLRFAFLILFFCFGTGILVYIILWIVIPEAKTTSEKLEMTGEPVNISNIEKKVREEFDVVSNKIKNANYDKIGNHFKVGAERVTHGVSDIVLTIIEIFSKIVGVIFILTGFVILIFLLIGIITLGSGLFIDFPWTSFIESGNYSDYPAWTFGLIMFFTVGIPFFFLTVLGFKLLSPNLKSIGRTTIYTLLAIWILASVLAISLGIKQAAAFAENGKAIQKQILNLSPTDTLFIKFTHNDFYSKNIDDRNQFKITEDSLKNKIIFSNDVSIKIEYTDDKLSYIKIEKQSNGKSISEANEKARGIQYHFKINGNQLVFDNYLITDFKNKFRDQEVEITLYLSKGMIFKCDSSVKKYDNSDNEKFNLHFSGNYSYRVEDNKIKCLNCPANENDDIDNENVSIVENDSIKTFSVTVNGKEILKTISGKK